MADRRALTRRGIVLPAVVVLVVGGSVAAYASTRDSDGADVVTSTAAVRDVTQQLDLTGTVAALTQRSVSPPASATVKSVLVSVGQSVKAGQALAVLDPGSLSSAVTSARATLLAAEATLETDSAATTTTSTSSSTSSSASSSARSKSGASGGSTQQLQATATRDAAAAQSALAAAAKLCSTVAAPASPATPSAVPSAAPSTAPSATASATSSSSPTAAADARPTGAPTTPEKPAGPAPTTCLGALQQVQTAQQTVAKEQAAVASALTKAAATTTSTGANTSGGATTSTTPTTPTTTSGATGQGGRGGTTTSKAATLTIDHAAVTVAQTAYDAAVTDLHHSTLVSPIDGTVASQPFTAGSTASTSDQLVVLGGGAVTVTVDVPLATLPTVEKGQRVSVTSSSSTTSGTVQAISLLPATATSTTPTYPVTVLVPDPTAGFVDGASVSAAITTKTVTGAVTVPNSALHTTGTTKTLAVLVKGTPTTTRVTTGAVGALYTQVLSGVTAGDEVVLADLSEALPTSSTTTTNRVGGGAGGFGGGAGGFPGAGAGGFGGGAAPGR